MRIKLKKNCLIKEILFFDKIILDFYFYELFSLNIFIIIKILCRLLASRL